MCGPRLSASTRLPYTAGPGMPGPYIQNSRPGFPQTRAALLINYYAFLIFSFALAAVSLAAFFAAAASSRRRSMAARVADSVSV